VANPLNQRPVKPLGFTLLELLITIVIVGVLLGIAIPNLQTFIQNNRQTSAMNDFIGMVSYARGEAVARNTNVALCIANAARDGCAGSGSNWASGYLVMVQSPAKVLKIYNALPGNQSMNASGFTTTHTIVFANNGLASSTGSFLFCDQRGNDARRGLTLNTGGQIRLAAAATLGNCPS
jgi:type IV fimbrial biogenesis protein FimT